MGILMAHVDFVVLAMVRDITDREKAERRVHDLRAQQ